jgi:hypothetical protein
VSILFDETTDVYWASPGELRDDIVQRFKADPRLPLLAADVAVANRHGAEPSGEAFAAAHRRLLAEVRRVAGFVLVDSKLVGDDRLGWRAEWWRLRADAVTELGDPREFVVVTMVDVESVTGPDCFYPVHVRTVR